MTLEPKIQKEYEKVKKDGGVIDFNFREKIRVNGTDRIKFLHRMLTNDIESLKPGEGTFACLLSAQAKIIADMILFVSEDHVTLDVMPGLYEKITNYLQKFIIADDVSFENVTSKICDYLVLGPKAESFIKSLTSEYPTKNLTHLKTTVNGMKWILDYFDLFETKAWAILSPKENEPKIKALLEKSGFPFLSPETVNILRIESGMPFYGVDFDDNIIILEAGLDFTISFTKGCYPGQEIVARMDGRSKFAKKLKQIEISGNKVPNPNSPITKNGKEIGKVTSAAFSPKIGRPLAFGYIARDYFNSGNEVQVESEKGRVL